MPRKPKPVAKKPGRKLRDASGSARLVIRLTATEAERMRVAAGEQPVSAWARARLLGLA